MKLLLTYDINTETAEGRRRLQHTAKLCESVGIRVQNSVFEMQLDPRRLQAFIERLCAITDPQTDSIRIYHLSCNSDERTQVFGRGNVYHSGQILVV